MSELKSEENLKRSERLRAILVLVRNKKKTIKIIILIYLNITIILYYNFRWAIKSFRIDESSRSNFNLS